MHVAMGAGALRGSCKSLVPAIKITCHGQMASLMEQMKILPEQG
jgi:hypothetical protein